jgi:N-acetylglucosaminyldiphosphoundecaprenol N-acetyl-beta-D-mannosaminyltransferase
MEARAEPASGGAALRPRPAAVATFERTPVCILGLPFDPVNLNQAVERIRADAFAGRRCWVSTPNLNFAIAALDDPDFRDSVLRSDLILVDGMPLVWAARLLGLPIAERVAGADVFEALQAHAGPPLDIFLFGGPPGAAAQASERIGRRGGGIRCVGFAEPGFGSVESMSGDDVIDRINRSGAHFVVVALGAKKGQEWLRRNESRLVAPVLSHLGAVVNFAAGSVRRAPRWVSRSGLEWLWRVKEEPALWRRYAGDGMRAGGILATRLLPEAIGRLGRRAPVAPRPTLARHDGPGGAVLQLQGTWIDATPELRQALRDVAAADEPLTIDLAGVSFAGNRFVAMLLLVRGAFGARQGFALTGVRPNVIATLRRLLADRALLGTM